MTQRRNNVPWFTRIAEQLEAGKPETISDILQRPIQLDPIVTVYLDRVGLFGLNVPERMTTFYRHLMGIRLDIANLADGKFDSDITSKARLIREDLALWDEITKLGWSLWTDLREIAQEPWRPIALWQAVKTRTLEVTRRDRDG